MSEALVLFAVSVGRVVVGVICNFAVPALRFKVLIRIDVRRIALAKIFRITGDETDTYFPPRPGGNQVCLD